MLGHQIPWQECQFLFVLSSWTSPPAALHVVCALVKLHYFVFLKTHSYSLGSELDSCIVHCHYALSLPSSFWFLSRGCTPACVKLSHEVELWRNFVVEGRCLEEIQKGELLFFTLVVVCSIFSGGLRGRVLERKMTAKIGRSRGSLLS